MNEASADDGFELAVERHVAASPAVLWRAWTERTEEWWCPKPWRVRVIEQDLRVGGRSAMLMLGPDGEESPSEGVFLEVVPKQRIVFTDAFRAGWIPQESFMLGHWEFTPEGAGTRVRACARHWTHSAMQQHEAMGFAQGWGTMLDQCAAVAEAMAAEGAR